MSRRFPRVKARFAATVQIGGVDHTLICHTRDISEDGCFLETSENIAAGVAVTLSVMDNERGEVVCVSGHTTRVIASDDKGVGVGVKLDDPPEDWGHLVDGFLHARTQDLDRPNIRLKIVVVSNQENRRGALALYVTSGWDIRFAVDAATATEAFDGIELDAVICELDSSDKTWMDILSVAKKKQPQARRLVRCETQGKTLPVSGKTHLVHRFVEIDNGMDALLDALTAELGVLKKAMTDPVTGALPLSREDSRTILNDIVSGFEGQDKLAVFDLDSTLLDNAPRQSAILREYGEKVGIPELVNNLPEHWESWDVGLAMSNGGLDDTRVEEHREPFKAYWRERFFTSEWCVLDEMIAGAADFVHAVKKAGAKVYYVTGRHEEMRDGSVRCLKRLGFPVPGDEEVTLLMKPTLEEDDDVYKHRTYDFLRKEGSVVAAFDNEPTHINGYRNAFPEAYSIHLATDHSGREVKVAEGVVSIVDFAALNPS